MHLSNTHGDSFESSLRRSEDERTCSSWCWKSSLVSTCLCVVLRVWREDVVDKEGEGGVSDFPRMMLTCSSASSLLQWQFNDKDNPIHAVNLTLNNNLAWPYILLDWLFFDSKKSRNVTAWNDGQTTFSPEVRVLNGRVFCWHEGFVIDCIFLLHLFCVCFHHDSWTDTFFARVLLEHSRENDDWMSRWLCFFVFRTWLVCTFFETVRLWHHS